jgi:riboflavin synthase
MFTGLISDIGEIVHAEGGRFRIGCAYDLDADAIGASICCDGCCLTVTCVETPSERFRSIFDVDVSNETLSRTTLGQWARGQRINLERSLTPSSEMGGHIVTGHVDCVAKVVEKKPDGESVRFMINAGKDHAHFIAEKGSVTLNGVSLTVNEVEGTQFGVNLIPHTLEATTWGKIKGGNEVNLEVDLLARYVARITEAMR